MNQLPEGMALEQVPKLKRRQRAIYLRPMMVQGKTIWIPTEPLPSDMQGLYYYKNKGFRLASEGVPEEELLAEETEGSGNGSDDYHQEQRPPAVRKRPQGKVRKT